MQHVIFGAGLIGGFLGGVLQSKGASVSLVARPAVQEKFKNGFKLTDYQQHSAETDAPRFIDSEDLAQSTVSSTSCNFLWLTVKCTAVESALTQLTSLVDADTVIICCQNGLGSEQPVKDAFPGNTVLRAMVQFNVAELAPNHLHRGSEGALTLEELPQSATISRQLVEQFDSELLPIHTSAEMGSLLWAKLQLNLANSVNALADIPVKQMIEQRDYRRVMSRLMLELIEVTRAKGVKLPKLTPLPAHWLPRVMVVPDALFRILGNRMLAVDPTVRTSMWWDLSQGKATEIEYLNGAIVAQGAELGIECPANQKIVKMIHEVEQGQRSQGIAAADLLAELSIR